MEFGKVDVVVRQSSFKGQPHDPQFRYRRLKLFLGPSMKGGRNDTTPVTDYGDWKLEGPNPKEIGNEFGLSTRTVQNSFTAGLALSAPPAGGLTYTRGTAETQPVIHNRAAMDVSKSKIDGTCHGGVLWDYVIRQNNRIGGFFELQSHSAISIVPETATPDGIQAAISTIFEIPRSNRIQDFVLRREIQGFLIGYKHINITAKVDVNWDETDHAVFPKAGHEGNRLSIQLGFSKGRVESKRLGNYELQVRPTK